MKSKYKFETVRLGDNITAVPIGKDTDDLRIAIRLNETGAIILDLLAKETTEEKIVSDILEKYDGDRDEVTGQVRDFLWTLKENGLVE